METVGYLAGEWVPANILMGATFLVAGIGVTALGIWVVRGDRINRDFEAQAGQEEQVGERSAHSEEPTSETPVH